MKGIMALFIIILIVLFTDSLDPLEKEYNSPNRVEDPFAKEFEDCDLNGNMKISKELFLKLIGTKFKDLIINDLSKKNSFQGKKNKNVRKNKIKKIENSFDKSEKLFLKAEPKIPKKINMTENINELKKLEKKINNTNKSFKNISRKRVSQSYALKIRMLTLYKFFFYLFKGFQFIIDMNQKTYMSEIQQEWKFTFECDKLNSNYIDFGYFNSLKGSLSDDKINPFYEWILNLHKSLMKIVYAIGNKCKGLSQNVLLFKQYIDKLSSRKIREDYLLVVKTLKNKAFNTLDKNSFPEAGYTIGKILGESLKITIF